MNGSLRLTNFKDVDLNDPFFDSLKAQYKEFPDWFSKKKDAEEPVYVVDDDAAPGLRGFVYLKLEEGAINDIAPPLPPARRIKVGTLKINAHGTKLGERVIKKVFDHAFEEAVDEIYVTVFDTHEGLIKLFERYGFVERGSKTTANGKELVLVRSLVNLEQDIIKDYPLIHQHGAKHFLLSIYPDYHTKLFPDSMLKTEKGHIVEDISYTNTIHKVYIGGCPLTMMSRGDVVVVYRTTDIKGKAWYRSVVTSICVIEDSKYRTDFMHEDDFVNYCLPHSVFTEEELREMWRDVKKRLYVVKMLYNAALPRRPNREKLIDGLGMTDPPRFDFRRISQDEFDAIVDCSELNKQLIVP